MLTAGQTQQIKTVTAVIVDHSLLVSMHNLFCQFHLHVLFTNTAYVKLIFIRKKKCAIYIAKKNNLAMLEWRIAL